MPYYQLHNTVPSCSPLIVSLALSSDGTFVASGSSTGVLAVYRIETLWHVHHIQPISLPPASITVISWSIENVFILLVADEASRVHVVRLRYDENHHFGLLDVHKVQDLGIGAATCIAESANVVAVGGKRLVILAKSTDDDTVHLSNPSYLGNHDDKHVPTTIHFKDKSVAIVSYFDACRHHKQALSSVRANQGGIYSCSLSPNGRSLIATRTIEGVDWFTLIGTSSTFKALHMRTTNTTSINSSQAFVSYINNGTAVMFGGRNGTIRTAAADEDEGRTQTLQATGSSAHAHFIVVALKPVVEGRASTIKVWIDRGLTAETATPPSALRLRPDLSYDKSDGELAISRHVSRHIRASVDDSNALNADGETTGSGDRRATPDGDACLPSLAANDRAPERRSFVLGNLVKFVVLMLILMAMKRYADGFSEALEHFLDNIVTANRRERMLTLG
ncbi:hypothetical protein OF83DRAFT_1177202 [Amylostereum chailletii]|nr:hypothetical protein OF83DRAFT_1177202 [Amylostereum chailletii]